MADAKKWMKIGGVAIAAWICASGLRSVLRPNHRTQEYVVNETVEAASSYYEIVHMPSELRVEAGFADVMIEYGDDFHVEANFDLDVDDGSDRLEIVDDGSVFLSGEAWIRVVIPHDTVFHVVDIENGAGRLSVADVRTEELYLDMGMGSTEMRGISVYNSADISAGTGEVSFLDVLLTDCDFDLGVGSVFVSGKITGNSEMDCGIGKLELVLEQSMDDLTIQFSSGIGSSTLNGREMKDDHVYGNGKNIIDIDGGTGEIRIQTE
ncbi:MAG: DUF4097 family beta strand repeat-containing protein [Bulleidia sp.]